MSFFSGLKKVLHFGGGIGRSGDGHSQGSRKLPAILRMEVDPAGSWDFIGELGDGAFGKVYKVILVHIHIRLIIMFNKCTNCRLFW